MRFLPLVLLFTFFVGATGCGDDSTGAGGDTDTDADSDSDSDSDSDTDSDSDPGAGLVGFWGGLSVGAVIAHTGIPGIGDQWSSARSWQLVEITSDGAGNLTVTETACLVKVKTHDGLIHPVVVVPQQTVDHMPPVERHVIVDGSGVGTEFNSDLVFTVRGANLCDVQSGPLPVGPAADPDSTSCDQACTDSHCDQDEDNHPGVTSHTEAAGILNCDVYAAARSWSQLDGEVSDADTITGTQINDGSETNILAATQALCASSSATVDNDGCAAHKYFRLLRLDGGNTCADVLALTDCDEDEHSCDANDVQPLDPNNDTFNGPEC